MRRTHDAPTELVELCKAEPFRALYHHDSRVRDVDSDLYDRCRDKHLYFTGGKFLHATVFLFLCHGSVEKPDFEFRKDILLQMFRFRLGGFGLKRSEER